VFSCLLGLSTPNHASVFKQLEVTVRNITAEVAAQPIPRPVCHSPFLSLCILNVVARPAQQANVLLSLFAKGLVVKVVHVQWGITAPAPLATATSPLHYLSLQFRPIRAANVLDVSLLP
jgi:hypothetical protein